MPTLNELRKRVAKLEAGTTASVVSFSMPSGGVVKMRSKRVIQVCSEAILGSRSQEVTTLLTSVGNNASHRLLELLKMCTE
jgi:hypothetical protein